MYLYSSISVGIEGVAGKFYYFKEEVHSGCSKQNCDI